MKKIFLLLVLLCSQTAFAGLWVTPEFVGNGDDDSVIVSFCTFDTTYYPTIADVDSLIALRFGPDNTLIDSLTQDSPLLLHPRSGWYELHLRGSNGSGSLGNYRVHVRVKIGGDWRGAGVVSYQVIEEPLGGYLAQLLADTDSLKDTLGVLQHKTDPITVDSGPIARSVWDDDVIAHEGRRIAWADSVDVVNSVPSSGSGAYACTLLVMESSTETAVPGAFLRLLNQDESTTSAIGRSDSNGRAMFALDASEYHIYPSLTGYQSVVLPETVLVTSGGVTDTVWLCRFDPGQPQTADLCRVYGWVQSLGSLALEGVTVSAAVPVAPLTWEGVIVSPYSLSATTDSSGYWFLDLIPSAELSPPDTYYDFTIYDQSGTVLRQQLAVPDSASFWLQW